MKLNLGLIVLLIAITGSAAAQESPLPSRERIRVMHQDISKWDKNGDGKLTGAERDAFLRDNAKERAAAETAARAANELPKTTPHPTPPFDPADRQSPVAKGVPRT